MLMFTWRFIVWRVEVSRGTCGVYLSDFRPYADNRGEAGMYVLHCLVTVVERTTTRPDLSKPALSQQAGREVTGRIGTQPSVFGDGSGASVRNYWCKTAWLHLSHTSLRGFRSFSIWTAPGASGA